MKKNILIFCGGTAICKLINAFIMPEIDLTLVINAYVDGKSTGYIKKYFQILGPSDTAKNLEHGIHPDFNETKTLLEKRINTYNELKQILK